VLQVAPGAKILPLRVLGPDGSGDVLSVMRAIDWAVVKGARVINLSLGSQERSRVVQDAIRRATSRGVLVVSSAGNENRSPITFPASDAASDVRALGVGSVDALNRKSVFSNYGTTLEMVAPGENVFGPGPGGQLVAWSGTSMAAPMAAGGLALALGQSLSVPLSDVTMKMAENGLIPTTTTSTRPTRTSSASVVWTSGSFSRTSFSGKCCPS
jgi:subtilisin family serine protease